MSHRNEAAGFVPLYRGLLYSKIYVSMETEQSTARHRLQIMMEFLKRITSRVSWSSTSLSERKNNPKIWGTLFQWAPPQRVHTCSMAAPMLTFLRRSSMAPLFYQAASYLWLGGGGPRSVSRACLFLAHVGGEETGGSINKNHADVHRLFQTRTLGFSHWRGLY